MEIQLTIRHSDEAPLRDSALALAQRIFSRFAPAIRRLAVVVEDENGPRGGLGQRCSAELILQDGRSLRSSRRHTATLGSLRLALGTLREHLAQGLGGRRGRDGRDYL